MTFWLHVVHPSSPLAKMAFKHQTAGCLSMFDVDVSDADVDAYLGETADIVKSSSHMFRPTMRDWGFLEFAPFEELQPNKYTDDSQNVTVMVRMRLSQAPYDSDFVLNHPDSDSDP